MIRSAAHMTIAAEGDITVTTESGVFTIPAVSATGDITTTGLVTGALLEAGAVSQGTPTIRFTGHTTTGIAYDTTADSIATLQGGQYLSIGRRTHTGISTNGPTFLFRVQIDEGGCCAFVLDYSVAVVAEDNEFVQSRTGTMWVTAHRRAGQDAVHSETDNGVTLCDDGTLTVSPDMDVTEGNNFNVRLNVVSTELRNPTASAQVAVKVIRSTNLITWNE